MSALGRGLAADLTVHSGARIRSLAREDEGTWMLAFEDESRAGPFEAVVLTCPAPQAAELLGEAHPKLAEVCANARILPCWSVLVAFDRPVDCDLDAAFVDDEVLSWMARESSKPGRPRVPECWTLHAAPDWSAHHLERPPGAVAEMVLDRFRKIVGGPGDTPVHLQAHRWRYARAAQPVGGGEPWIDCAGRIALAGDWLRGDRIEDAFLSGHATGSELARVMDGSF
jgi:predicted NAD/FAD-dependent oxidoreductase